LAKASYLSITKDDIIQRNDPSKVAIAKKAYEAEDVHLNKIWKSIPASFRASMKNEQVSWVWDKENKCGSIERANNASLSTSARIEIYECQTEMTKARIKYLSGQQ
ncbi:TPA: lysozyme inhibitor LprI family protein, partial [Aeromonas hydrophila]